MIDDVSMPFRSTENQETQDLSGSGAESPAKSIGREKAGDENISPNASGSCTSGAVRHQLCVESGLGPRSSSHER